VPREEECITKNQKILGYTTRSLQNKNTPRGRSFCDLPPEITTKYPDFNRPGITTSLEEVFVVGADLGKMECRVRPDVTPVKLEVGNLRFLVLAPL
jgi:hypothetical protein